MAAPGFLVTTSDGDYDARNVVVATGPFQVPAYPRIIPEGESVLQLHSSTYKNPGQLPEGSVLVVGAGASGTQIAEELRNAGRTVYLSVGEHYRPPRSYRGRDYVWWLGALGLWDEVRIKPKKAHVAFAVSGYEGGKTVDFRRLAHSGITLVGLTKGYTDGVLEFQGGLAADIAEGDRAYFEVLRDADAYIEQNGLDFPPEPEAWELLPDPQCLTQPILSLDLAKAGITTVLWATGFKADYSWLKVDVFDETGNPFHKRGISAGTGHLLPRPSQPGQPGLVLHLRRVARREVHRRPHRAPGRLHELFAVAGEIRRRPLMPQARAGAARRRGSRSAPTGIDRKPRSGKSPHIRLPCVQRRCCPARRPAPVSCSSSA